MLVCLLLLLLLLLLTAAAAAAAAARARGASRLSHKVHDDLRLRKAPQRRL
jgi:hypothetical protein